MTEAEWLACNELKPMLNFVEGKATDRKMRLFACACCRRVWHLLTHRGSREGVEGAERFVDARTNLEREALKLGRRSAREAEQADRSLAAAAARAATGPTARWAAEETPHLAALAASRSQRPIYENETSLQATLTRCIFGNPFHPVPFDRSWLTPAVLTLARAIYDERAFDHIPELADALAAAGCTNADILEHCRGPGPHARGCWVVDLILGKS